MTEWYRQRVNPQGICHSYFHEWLAQQRNAAARLAIRSILSTCLINEAKGMRISSNLSIGSRYLEEHFRRDDCVDHRFCAYKPLFWAER
jgi:hypothetical protein